MDTLNAEQRSRTMRAIKGRNTTPEIAVRKLLHKAGFRFRLHSRKLPGHPDIVLPKYRTVIFVHGCFWHQHPGCRRASRPSSRIEYWIPKLERNVARDAEIRSKLESLGWRVLVVWECESKNEPVLSETLLRYFTASPPRPLR